MGWERVANTSEDTSMMGHIRDMLNGPCTGYAVVYVLVYVATALAILAAGGAAVGTVVLVNWLAGRP